MTKMVLRLAALSLVALLLFAPTAGAQGKTTTVSIKDFAFNPSNATVSPGTTVTWVNNDQTAHTVTANDGAFDSGTLQPGQSYSFAFDKAGTYAYHCNIHPTMTATVTVSGASSGSASGSASASASPTTSGSASPTASATAGPGTPLPSSGGPSSLGVVAALALVALGAVALVLVLVRRGGAAS